MLGFQGGVSIPLVKGGVKAPPAKRQCRAGPKAGARRGFTFKNGNLWQVVGTWSMTATISITLPPDPGAAGKATLQGIDSDGDGVRDDIQRYIALTYPN